MLKRLMSKLSDDSRQPMPKSSESVDLKRMAPLSEFVPFVDLRQDIQILMVNFSETITLKKGELLFNEGDEDSRDYFLISGKMSVLNSDGREKPLEGGSPEANRPLSFLRPRQFTAKVASATATFYQLPHHVVTLAEERTRKVKHVNRDFSVEEDFYKKTLLERIEKEVSSGKLSLVSLPEVAIKVKNICAQPDASLDDIADIVVRDGSMSIKLVQAANSPLY